MCTIYENIKFLCDQRGIKPGRMCTDIGISKSILTGLKNGTKKNIQTDTAQKIADYFGVTVDRVLGAEQKEKLTIPEEGELTADQIKAIEKIKNMPPEELAKKMAALEAVLDM